jgi:hypothetical protein
MAADQEWIVWRFVVSYWTPVDSPRRLSDSDACRIFSLRGPGALPPAVQLLPPAAVMDRIKRASLPPQ